VSQKLTEQLLAITEVMGDPGIGHADPRGHRTYLYGGHASLGKKRCRGVEDQTPSLVRGPSRPRGGHDQNRTLTCQGIGIYTWSHQGRGEISMPLVEDIEDRLPGSEDDAALVPLFRGVWSLAPYVVLPGTPVGTRAIVEMTDGRLEGRGIRARARPHACADWLVIGADGTGTMDYRGTVETEEGHVIYLYGGGRCDLSSGFGQDTMLCGAVHFETSCERYRWLNRVNAVFRGVVVGDGAAGNGILHDEWFEVR
jgi:Protein of unknown function (DUF3237)